MDPRRCSAKTSNNVKCYHAKDLCTLYINEFWTSTGLWIELYVVKSTQWNEGSKKNAIALTKSTYFYRTNVSLIIIFLFSNTRQFVKGERLVLRVTAIVPSG